MQNIKEIESEWNLWREIPFPSNILDKDIGSSLVELDTFTAGCISTFLTNKGWMSGECQSILANNKKELNLAIPKLDGNTKMYFERLLYLTNGVLRFIEIQSH